MADKSVSLTVKDPRVADIRWVTLAVSVAQDGTVSVPNAEYVYRLHDASGAPYGDEKHLTTALEPAVQAAVLNLLTTKALPKIAAAEGF